MREGGAQKHKIKIKTKRRQPPPPPQRFLNHVPSLSNPIQFPLLSDGRPMTSGCAAATNSSGSPRTTAHRRRVADFADAEKALDVADEVDSGAANVAVYHDHPVIRYLSLLRKDTWQPDWTPAVAQALASGRLIFVLLMVMVVASVFVKVSFFIGGGSLEVAVVERDKAVFVRTLKDDLAVAQRAVSEVETSPGAVMPKRLLEKLPVSVLSSIFPRMFSGKIQENNGPVGSVPKFLFLFVERGIFSTLLNSKF